MSTERSSQIHRALDFALSLVIEGEGLGAACEEAVHLFTAYDIEHDEIELTDEVCLNPDEFRTLVRLELKKRGYSHV